MTRRRNGRLQPFVFRPNLSMEELKQGKTKVKIIEETFKSALESLTEDLSKEVGDYGSTHKLLN